MDSLPRLVVITDWTLDESVLLSRLAEVLALGPRVGVQHRHPGASAKVFLEQGRKLAALCEKHRNPLFVNERLDIALLLNAHLHLPTHGPSVSDVRPHLLKGRWVSAAVHNIAELKASSGADFFLASPVFAAGSKVNDVRPTLGPTGFSALAKSTTTPVYALGGITADTARSLPDAKGFAAISGILAAKDPAAAARTLISSRRA
ncbi:MAG: thiamine phosphate synthase [Myxococcaceae bacterium]